MDTCDKINLSLIKGELQVTFLHAVLLKCLHKINGERSASSIYHLLTGKKSLQTIQDGELYQLSYLFKTLPKFSREQFHDSINELRKKEFIQPLTTKNYFSVTKKGILFYENIFRERPFPKYIDGHKYQDTAIQMWKRLTLLIQVVSHLIHSSNRYVPIIQDYSIQRWVRNYVLQFKEGRFQLADNIYNDLSTIFADNFPEDPNILILRFSGYQMIGKTSEQVAELMKMDPFEYHYRFINAQHFIIQRILKERERFSFLPDLIIDTYQASPITKTAMRTYELLKRNLSIKEIAQIRGLKESTIEDHIIEIALFNKQFSIEPYVDKTTAEKILTIANELGVKRMKPIKERIGTASYFQIRLVLASLGVKQ